jgi:hypothetical protein
MWNRNNWFIAGFALALILCVGFILFPRQTSDANWYVALAMGKRDVPKPWGTRILHPFLAGWIARTTGISLESAFFFLALVATFVVGLLLAQFAYKATGNPWWSLLAVHPGLLQVVGSIYLNDLFLLAVVLIFYFALSIPPIALLFAVLAVLTREVGLVAVVIAGAILLAQGKRLYGAGLIFTGLFAWFVLVPHIASTGTNLHGASEIVYMVARSFAAFVKNFLGFQIWTDSLAQLWAKWEMGDCKTPLFSLTLPVPIGNVHKVGLCPWQPEHILVFATVYLTGWGVLPGLIWTNRHQLRQLLAKLPVDIRAGSLFGLTMSILAPFITYGFALCRLAIYAVIPIVSLVPCVILTLHRNFNPSNWQIVSAILTHIALNLVFLLALMGVIGIRWIGIWAILGAIAQVTLARFAKAEVL